MGPIDDIAGSLRAPLCPPVVVRRILDGPPRLFAAGAPVTPLNLAIRNRVEQGQTAVSARSYGYALGLFLSFLASRERSLIGATNADFAAFCRALAGAAFSDANGATITLPGSRSASTCQSIVSRLYGIFGDVETAYAVTFDWRRYKPRGYRAGRTVQAREHRFRVPAREPLGLPDEQFAKLIERASELWADEIPDGDRVFAASPEQQRGALFVRNVAVLLVLRFAGARRAEVGSIDLGDIDRLSATLRLATKGRSGAKEAVVLLPVVDAALARYLLSFRPYGLRRFRPGSRQRPRAVDQTAVFLSHSVHRYGERISPETVRLVIDRLRPALDPPWNRTLHPHSLRHAFAHELQRLIGPFGASANLRHRSLSSMDPYRGSVLDWAETLRDLNASALDQFARAGLDGLG